MTVTDPPAFSARRRTIDDDVSDVGSWIITLSEAVSRSDPHGVVVSSRVETQSAPECDDGSERES